MSAAERVVLVTGATGGIGFEIAAQAAEAGWIVAVHGSRSATVEIAVRRLRERIPNAKLTLAPADFRDLAQIEKMVATLIAEAGRLDALIDCAMIYSEPSVSGAFLDIDPLAFNRPGTGAVELQRICHFVLPKLHENGGSIVAFASDSGRFAAPLQSGIGAKQGAIIAFVRNLALEVARYGVRANCISPSFVADTPIYERMKGNGGRVDRAQKAAGLGLPKPADIAPLALFLCSEGARHVTGQVISVNGGINA